MSLASLVSDLAARIAQEFKARELNLSRIGVDEDGKPFFDAAGAGGAVPQAATKASMDNIATNPSLIAAFAQRPASTEKTIYVGTGSGASDANDGLTPKLAKATIPAAVAALPTGGGIVQLGAGVHTLTSTLNLADGVTLRGIGYTPWQATAVTRIDATAVSNSTPAILLNNVSNATLQDFYLTGRASGSADEIATTGTCRALTFDRIEITSSTSGSGIYLGSTGSVITSRVIGVRINGPAYGFQVSAMCTSIAFSNCYGSSCTTAGYLILGTYNSFTACAADSSGLYGYLIQGVYAIGNAFIGCGAEANFRAAFHVVGGATGTAFIACRSHGNNTCGSAGLPSFLGISSASDYVTAISCSDTAPAAGTTVSVGSLTGTAGANVVLLNCSLTLPTAAINSKIKVGASAAVAGASFGVPHGVAPTTPVDGDIWTTTAGLFVRVNGVTKTVTLT